MLTRALTHTARQAVRVSLLQPRLTLDARAMSTGGASPFTRSAVAALRRLYPEELADKSFDNTGLLLEAPADAGERAGARDAVLLTIDLTAAVADEAIEGKVSLVVAYHPIIFRALKSLTFANTQQRSLLRLAAAGISVYSPHTAVDAAPNGNADWLASLLLGTRKTPPERRAAHASAAPVQAAGYAIEGFAPHAPPPAASLVPLGAHATVSAVTPSSRSSAQPGTGPPEGAGRLIALEPPAQLGVLLRNLTAGLGGPRAFSIALPRTTDAATPVEQRAVRRVGVCAGSGGSVLAKLAPAPDLVVTGEMSHHEALAYVEGGTAVVCLAHSNSERGYLWDSMKPMLEAELRQADVLVSSADADPFSTAVRIA